MNMLLKAAFGLVSIYAVVVFGVWLGQRRLLYVPDPRRIPPQSVGLGGVTEQEFQTADGNRLVVWRSLPRTGRPTILYFHGNAGNLASRAGRMARYRALGYGVVMMSYRGYGGSTGQPSEKDNVADARQLYRQLIAEGLAPADVALYGESLGSGVAVQLAVAESVGAVILDAPYTSILNLALRNYFYLPVRPLLVDRYESDRRITSINAPVLVLHGRRDGVIPVEMGEALFAMAVEPKKLVVFPNGGHSDLDEFGAVEVVHDWLATLRAGK